MLPKNSALLTFDDAYIDHFITVFPILNEKKIQGCFFPPAKAILKNEVLDVNKIHFILASANDIMQILSDLKRYIEDYRESYSLQNFDYYFTKLAKDSRYDPKEVIFIKRLLQHELDLDIRRKITDKLFAKYVTVDSQSFSRELYMNLNQLKCMARNGMYIGGHGYDHFWLNTLTEDEQEEEILETVSFLNLISPPINQWVMCYPYGAYNGSLISVLKKKQCKMALSTKIGIAQLDDQNAFCLSRLDTNDFPKVSNALPNQWTQEVIG